MLVQQLVSNEPKWPLPKWSFQGRAGNGPWGRETGREGRIGGAGFKWSSLARGSRERSLHTKEKHTLSVSHTHTHAHTSKHTWIYALKFLQKDHEIMIYNR